MQLSTKEKNRLSSKYGNWALITGASSGIGLELTKLLASANFNLVIVARNTTKLNALKKELSNKYSIDIQVITADLAKAEETEKVINEIKNLEIGLFIASAGFGTSGSIQTTSLHSEMNMMRVNCESLFMLTHYFSQRFSERKKGGIILLSSMVAFQGVPFAANYAATKAYVQTLAEGLYEELKPFGVDVLAAAPGPVKSGFETRANMQMNMSLKPEQVGVPILKALGRKQTVLPGSLTKLLVYSLRTVPRWTKVKIMKNVMGGMTAHQRT